MRASLAYPLRSVAAAVAVALLAHAPAAAQTPRSAGVFAIDVEQGRNSVPIKGREARVKKAPFTVVVDLNGIPGVYVHAAFDKAFYEKAQRGEPLGRVFREAQTQALGNHNEQQLLFINDEDSHQFWYADSRTEHDFSSLIPVAGALRGRRVIANLWLAQAPVPLQEVPESTLYFVFYAGDLSKETDDDKAQRAHERQREMLKVTLKR